MNGTPARTAYGSRPVPQGGAELFIWLFMRVSGVFLVVLAIGHLIIMHVLNSVHIIDAQFVWDRWDGIFWRCYDWVMLFLAIAHGTFGMRTLALDYVPPRFSRAVLFLMYLVSGLVFTAGTWVLLFFQQARP